MALQRIGPEEAYTVDLLLPGSSDDLGGGLAGEPQSLQLILDMQLNDSLGQIIVGHALVALLQLFTRHFLHLLQFNSDNSGRSLASL